MAIYDYLTLPERLIQTDTRPHCILTICIPCYAEEDLITTLKSIQHCDSIPYHVEIIVLINESDSDSPNTSNLNHKTYNDACIYANAIGDDQLSLHIIYVRNIPKKKAGVGLARKLAMDEAARRYEFINMEERGVIVCMDADTTVAPNYLREVTNYFSRDSAYQACSIAFEHQLQNTSPSNRNAIIKYELHLRYFINMQRIINLPYAFQTVGSAMAVTCIAYRKQGGMNTRKAGEDFYFLQKFISNNLCRDLTTTAVYPSARESDRVPFGTGKAIGDINKENGVFYSYNPQSFTVVKQFIKEVELAHSSLQDGSLSKFASKTELSEWLDQSYFHNVILEIFNNTSNKENFMARFFKWFDAFRLMKALHYLRDNIFPNVDVVTAGQYLFSLLELEWTSELDQNLVKIRAHDRDRRYLMPD